MCGVPPLVSYSLDNDHSGCNLHLDEKVKDVLGDYRLGNDRSEFEVIISMLMLLCKFNSSY